MDPHSISAKRMKVQRFAHVVLFESKYSAFLNINSLVLVRKCVLLIDEMGGSEREIEWEIEAKWAMNGMCSHYICIYNMLLIKYIYLYINKIYVWSVVYIHMYIWASSAIVNKKKYHYNIYFIFTAYICCAGWENFLLRSLHWLKDLYIFKLQERIESQCSIFFLIFWIQYKRPLNG